MLFLFTGCSNTSDKTTDETNTQNTNISTSTNTSVQSSITESEITVKDLFDSKEIPIPSDAELKDNTLVFTTNDTYTLTKNYFKSMLDAGWKEVDALGKKHFYEKEIDGNVIKISVTPKEQENSSDKIIIDFKIKSNK